MAGKVIRSSWCYILADPTFAAANTACWGLRRAVVDKAFGQADPTLAAVDTACWGLSLRPDRPVLFVGNVLSISNAVEFPKLLYKLHFYKTSLLGNVCPTV